MVCLAVWQVLLCTMKAVVSCSALQQNVLFGFAGMQLAEPPHVQEEGKGWEAAAFQQFCLRGSSLSTVNGRKACDLASATVLPPPKFSLDVRKIQAVGDSVWHRICKIQWE